MCLAIPGRIIKVEGKTAVVDFGGVKREVRLDLLPEVGVGDYVIVHTGFAIERLDEKRALEILEAWAEVGRALEG
ncbi:HypC/HybG/HupF family hydrogenase formation chaperone [Thermococcus sp. 18S1]|uniref:HypC/HybG/HupF family hydrogenase formation chaperone n=1 Tax=Thermococcus sp. 18S1 TaxID=1638210 RepID=UPI00143BDDDB|nr:HypC/HybG/HupF family hydrogenase formation chaperone [Thermococcus sp. 18S1]NJE30676.1 HypC/HybG/HupF family hydrogenase formation chaperone [Thermococcus sp. 18S1]